MLDRHLDALGVAAVQPFRAGVPRLVLAGAIVRDVDSVAERC